LTYSWASGDCHVESYARIDEGFQARASDLKSYMQELCDTFNGAIRRTLTGAHSFGMSLSGGLDSRTILSALNSTGMSISTYTLGVRGCADEVIAAKLARIAGTPHHFCELDTSYLTEYLPNLQRLVSLTDGMYLTHGLTEILALRHIESTGISVLLRGHGGELAKARLAWPLHTDHRIHRMRSKAELIPYIFARVNYISPAVDLQKLLTGRLLYKMKYVEG